MTPYLFQRGETISLALDALEGDPASVTTLSAQLKAVPPGRTSVPAGEPVAAQFTISARAATAETSAGWTLVIPAATSAGLSPGLYHADARLNLAAGVVVTEPVALRIRQAVTT
ncbi:MAG TPA: hypothetical protein PKA59_01530 [Chakrabartia sp.]|jgi:hypothetical protein|nr:hypothetical protein [Chakrabartia sp.]